MSAPSRVPAVAVGTATAARPPAAIALAVIGGCLALNSLALGSQTFFDPRPYSEVGATPAHRAYYIVLVLGLLALSQVLARLDRIPGRGGRALPTALVVAAGFGVGLDACSRYVAAFVVPYLADRAPDLLDDSTMSPLAVAMIASWSVAGLTLSAVGVSAFRRRLVARGVAAALVAGPLTLPVLGPLSWVIIGTALLLAGLDLARLRSSGVRTANPPRT